MTPTVLHYNVHGIARLFDENREGVINPYLTEDTHYGVFSLYNTLGLNRNPIYDRTGLLPHYLKMSNQHPMPAYDPAFTKSFHEVAEARAKEILALGKPIKVCWSGGIDSTYVLFTLLKYANTPDQITVYGTYASVIESGYVFDKHIKNQLKFELSISPGNNAKSKVEDCIWVTGFQGNQLFGPTDNFFASNRSVAFFHHTLGTPETIYSPYEKNVREDILEFLQPTIDASPRKIETVADLRWYCIFNLDWYNGLYEMKSEMTPWKMDTVHHFFDSIDFQKWAITTKDPWTKIPGNPNTHRWQMRDAMEDYGLGEYARTKSKSISSFSSNNANWVLLLNNNQNVYL